MQITRPWGIERNGCANIVGKGIASNHGEHGAIKANQSAGASCRPLSRIHPLRADTPAEHTNVVAKFSIAGRLHQFEKMHAMLLSRFREPPVPPFFDAGEQKKNDGWEQPLGVAKKGGDSLQDLRHSARAARVNRKGDTYTCIRVWACVGKRDEERYGGGVGVWGMSPEKFAGRIAGKSPVTSTRAFL